MPHEPEKMFKGHLRTSTFVLLLVFAGILVLYVFVRPAPAQPPSTKRSSTVQPQHKVSPTPTHAPASVRLRTPKTTSTTPSMQPGSTKSMTPSVSPSPSTTHSSPVPMPSQS